jgi:hypothetical protein
MKKQIKKKENCANNKHLWGDVVKEGTIGCCLCDARKKVSYGYAKALGNAQKMEANYTYRDEH